MRWWGWGEDGADVELPDAGAALLGEEIGFDPAIRRRPVAEPEVRLPEPQLPEATREALARAVGAEHVLDDRSTRLGHAAGRSYPDLIRLRSGDGASAPDAVVLPGSAAEVKAVLEACGKERVAVVPFGGGTSVVGGVEPLRDGFAAVVSLDLGRLNRVVSVDRMSLTATLEAGLRGPDAERALGQEGLTLGHHPQSFEYSTVGGWVATRSAGQASTGYGRIDEIVEGLRLVAPAGELDTRALPASAAGPDLRELLVGSEGVLGVICDATLRVRPLPAERRYEGWSFRSFAEGCEAFRVMEQADASPDVARLSNENETRLALALASPGGRAVALVRRYLRARGHERGCVAIAGFEGTADEVERRRQRSAALLRAGGGVALGRRPGDAWRRTRYAGPYLRDALLDRGVLTETLETATNWSNLEPLYRGVDGGAPSDAGGAGHSRVRALSCLSPLPVRRLALFHLLRPAGGRRARPVGGREGRCLGGDSRRRRDDHPSPCGRPRPCSLDAGRGGGAGPRADPRGQGEAGPRRDHEPRQAAALAGL